MNSVLILTNSLVEEVALLRQLHRMYISPLTILPQHLTVQHSYQQLLHLPLQQ